MKGMKGRHRPIRRVPPPYVARLLVTVLVLGMAVVIVFVLVTLVPLDVPSALITLGGP